MGIFSRRKPEQRSAANTFSIGDPALAAYFGIGTRSSAGMTVSENTALTLSGFYRAGALISGTIASLPMRSLRTTDDDLRERVSSFLDEPAGPDSYTAFEWKEQVVWHLFLQGDAFLIHVFNGAGALVGLNPVHPLAVRVEWDEARPGGKLYTLTLDDGSKREYDMTTLTQIMGPSLDGLRGMSLIERGRNSLGTALAGDEAAGRLFANGALLSGIVTPDEDVTEAEAQQMKESFSLQVQGTENAGDIAFVNRRLKFQPWSVSAVDAQFLESRQFSIEEISRWTGVPPHLLMQTDKQTSWGTGVSEQNRGLREFVLLAYTSRIEQRLSRLLSASRFAEFDYAGLEKPSPEQEIDLLIKQVNAGLITPNEARRIRNMPPSEDPNANLLRIPPGSVPPAAAPEQSPEEGEPNGDA